MKTVPASHHHFAFDPTIEPVVTVEPGDLVRIETSAEPVERLFDAGRAWPQVVDTRRINAVSGPVSVEGAEPGDALAVEIAEIETLDWGWCMWLPGYGLLGRRARQPMLRRFPIHDGRVWLSDAVSVPLEPMVGCLGVAPSSGTVSTIAPVSSHAGNYDLHLARAGATLLFPVQVPGALFSLGDLHAAMGAGEATSVAIECAGAATVRFGIRKGLDLRTPRVETGERIYTLGISTTHDRAASQAVDEMYGMLTGEFALDPETAYLIVSAAVDLEFAGPASPAVAAGVDRSLLSRRGGVV